MAQDLVRPRRGWLFRAVIGPALLLALYGSVLMVVLPEGINRRFIMVVALVASGVVAGAVVVSVASWRARRLGTSGDVALGGDEDRLSRSDVWLLLLPVAPVVQYMVVNRDTVSPFGAVVATTTLAAVAALLALVIPHLARRTLSRTVSMMVGLSLTFVLYNMASFAKSNRWYGMEDATLPLAVFAALVVGGAILYRFRREGVYAIAGAYFLGTVVLVPLASDPTTVTASEAQLVGSDAAARDEALATIARGEVDELPSIIILTYDAYVENETMMRYGIDNSAQEAFLESRGFDIQRGTYTVAGDSMASMGRAFGGTVPGDAVAGDSPLLDAARTAGYQTMGVFDTDYLFSRSDPAYDWHFPDPLPSYLTMVRGILEGRFRHDLALRAPQHQEFVDAKRSALASDPARPRLVYVHAGGMPGHSQNSGTCLDDETERFQRRLTQTNLEMRDDIATVLEHRPGAIVIVNGDHGPYLTKNCVGLHQYGGYETDEVTRLDIQDRFGSFLAVRWPEGLRSAGSEIEVLQDILPAVFGEVFPNLDSDALRGSTRLADGQEAVIAGVNVEHGTIVGGRFDGLPLFEGSSAKLTARTTPPAQSDR